MSWTSPVYVKLYSNDSSINPLPEAIIESEDAWIGSVLTLGAVVGPFPALYVCSKFGRKKALLITAVPLILSFFAQAFATNIYTIYVMRIFSGLSLGAGYALLPVYIGEMSEDHNRGMISQIVSIFWSFGNFIVYATGPFMSYKEFNIMIAAVPTIFFISFFWFAPESPYYLVAKNKLEEAEKALMLLRSKSQDEVQEAIKIINGQLEEESGNSGGIIGIFGTAYIRKAFIICLLLVFCQEFCGYSVLLFYMQLIFQATGSILPDDISSLVISIFILITSFVSPFIIDIFGRKVLLVVACVGMFFSLSALGIFFYLLEETNVSTEPIYWLPLTSLVIYIFFFNFGMTVPWTVAAELLPSSVKETSLMLITSASSLLWFVMTKFFNDLTDALGLGKTFWCFAIYCLVAATAIILFLPETGGKSFSDIQDNLKNGGLLQIGFNKKNVTEKNELEVEKY